MIRLTRYRFKLKDKDKLRVNPSYLAHHILLWIAYIDNVCNMHRALKDKNQKYPVRMC